MPASFFRIAVMSVCRLATAGCSQQVTLAYISKSQIPVTDAIPAGSRVIATDDRGESDPTWIGAIRGGFGNPLKVLHTSKPLSDVVAKAFQDGLAAHGFLAPSGSGDFDLKVAIRSFESGQMVRREANVDFIIDLLDRSSKHTVYHDEVQADIVTGSIIALDVGVFGSTDDLRVVGENAMNQAIDRALNNSGFIAILHTGRQPAPVGAYQSLRITPTLPRG